MPSRDLLLHLPWKSKQVSLKDRSFKHASYEDNNANKEEEG